MNQEERIFAGFMFNPGAPELVAIKRRSHGLSREYSALSETETEKRIAYEVSVSKLECVLD